MVDYKDYYGTVQDGNKNYNENEEDRFMKRRYSKVMLADPYQNKTVGPEKFRNVGYKLPKIRSQSIRNKEVVMNYDFEKNPSHQVNLNKYFGQGRASVDNRP